MLTFHDSTVRYHSPLVAEPMKWGSLEQLSLVLGRSYPYIYKITVNGVLADFGIASYQDHRGRWWVRFPESYGPCI